MNEIPNGVIVLNKPSGPTSAGCLNKIKRAFKIKKIGHAGTLDPLADGVLVVLLGSATKIASHLTSGGKIYRGKLRLGVSTDTYDVQGTVTNETDPSHITTEMAREAMESWNELTEQEVPAYSAAKHKGKPLYALVREGKEVPVKIKPVRITEAAMLEAEPPVYEFRVACSAGTYIRSLVHSLGTRLGCGAVMEALTREFSHPFGLDQALELEDILATDDLSKLVIPMDRALPHWTKLTLSEPYAKLIRNGAMLPASELPLSGRVADEGEQAMFLGPDGSPLALAEVRDKNGRHSWSILRGLWT